MVLLIWRHENTNPRFISLGKGMVFFEMAISSVYED